jgi:heparosan-N-sulfate-glucuronate 5-epimerase
LNGFLYTIIGISDLRFLSDEALAELKPERFIKSLENLLPKYDLGFWSTYDLHHADGRIPNPASFIYHSLHISQLEYLGLHYRSSPIRECSARWASYRGRLANRCRALIGKLRYRRLEKAQR